MLLTLIYNHKIDIFLKMSTKDKIIVALDVDSCEKARSIVKALDGHANFFKIGLGFSYQKIKKIPINKYDKKLDLIVSEKKIIQ